MSQTLFDSSSDFIQVARRSKNTPRVLSLPRDNRPLNSGSKPFSKPFSKPSVGIKPSNPVCPHCRNLNLPFDHWLRETAEPNSKVMCPVLLATECRYCHEFGHTVSNCTARKCYKNTNTYDRKDTTFCANRGKNTELLSKYDVRGDDSTESVSSASPLALETTPYEETSFPVIPRILPSAVSVEQSVYLKESNITYDYSLTFEQMIADRRAFFITRGRSWAEMCDSDNDE